MTGTICDVVQTSMINKWIASVKDERQMGGGEHNVEQNMCIALLRACPQAYVVAKIFICDLLAISVADSFLCECTLWNGVNRIWNTFVWVKKKKSQLRFYVWDMICLFSIVEGLFLKDLPHPMLEVRGDFNLTIWKGYFLYLWHTQIFLKVPRYISHSVTESLSALFWPQFY